MGIFVGNRLRQYPERFFDSNELIIREAVSLMNIMFFYLRVRIIN